MRTEPTPIPPDPDAALRRRAHKRVALKTGWLIHALVFVLVNAGLWLLRGAWWPGSDGPGGEPWLGPGGHRHGWPLFGPMFWGWGLGLAIHGAVVAMKLYGDGMHDRMVEREVERLRRRGRG